MESFSDFEVVVQLFFVFVSHGLDNFKVGNVKGLVAVLIVLAYATMRPIAFLDGALVLSPPSLTATASLANIDLFAFRANMFIYPWFFSWVNFCYIIYL